MTNHAAPEIGAVIGRIEAAMSALGEIVIDGSVDFAVAADVAAALDRLEGVAVILGRAKLAADHLNRQHMLRAGALAYRDARTREASGAAY